MFETWISAFAGMTSGAGMNIAQVIQSALDPETRGVIERVAALADEKNARVVVVGGAVRDMLLGQKPGDADLMLEHPAKPIVSALAGALGAQLISHERFFTFTLKLKSGKKIDVVTSREETYPAPAKLPDVTPAPIEKDLRRRDFTVNAVACWVNKGKFGEVLDPFSGHADMKKKVVRALHQGSFVDDPTRLFRAARFAGRLGFQVEPETGQWILDAIKAGGPKLLSPVRLRHEFELILKENDPSAALVLLKRWDAIGLIHPGWRDIDPSAAPMKPGTPLNDRLADWLRPFGNERAETMMTDLAFEKGVKAEVLSKLVQSPSTS